MPLVRYTTQWNYVDKKDLPITRSIIDHSISTYNMLIECSDFLDTCIPDADNNLAIKMIDMQNKIEDLLDHIDDEIHD